MTIRQLLLICISSLALFVLVMSGNELRVAFQHKKTLEFASESSRSIELLLIAAGHWAVERGVTNSGIQSSSMPSERMMEIIATRRSKGNAAFEEAMTQIEGMDFSNKTALLSTLGEAYQRANDYRALADLALRKQRNARSDTLLNEWVGVMSHLIVMSQDVRFALTQATAEAKPELGRQALLKHFAWMMSEFSGRERAIIGGILSSGVGMYGDNLQKLTSFRANVETGWRLVKKISVKSNEAVQKSVEDVQLRFFRDFESLRADIYEAGTGLREYPVTTQAWIDQSTQAINSILDLQAASIKETEDTIATLRQQLAFELFIHGGLVVASLLLVAFSYYVVGKRVSRPLENMTRVMQELAQGNLDTHVPHSHREDEMGRMARSVAVFKQSALERQSLQEEQKRLKEEAKAERKRAKEELAERFENKVQHIIVQVAETTAALAANAELMTQRVVESGSLAQASSQSAKNASGNVQSVAAAAEEMSATIQDISSQMHTSNSLVSQSMGQVEHADAQASKLADASERVREVIQLVADIAGQINLLALNATIESARAGEAGKGFAVVAGEVKNLANQTDRSIQEVERVIAEMTDVSATIIDALNDIKTSVTDIVSASGSVAAAVEEQSATTQDIASNMQSASQGTQEISDNLSHITQQSDASSLSAKEMQEAVRQLSEQSETLKQEVTSFIHEIRTEA